jgi:hypothetical protein
MLQLTDALNRIKTWLSSNYPLMAESITPGLNPEEIRSIVETLPFSLPEEVYKLYQWSGGHYGEALNSVAFDPYDVMYHVSLKYAIELQSILEEADVDECVTKYINKPLFPLFDFNGTSLCSIGDWADNKSSPIILVSAINEITISYTSLTNMMLTVAESFESGAFRLDENGHKEWNKEVFFPIYLKHNSDMLKVSIMRLKQELITGKDNDTFSEMTVRNFKDDICYLVRKRQDFLTNQFGIEVLQPLITAMQDENEIVRNLSRQALEELNYNFDQD